MGCYIAVAERPTAQAISTFAAIALAISRKTLEVLAAFTNVTPFKNGHRIALRCPGKTDVELVAIKLRLDARGRLRAELEWRDAL
jgi:hypothetical protein